MVSSLYRSVLNQQPRGKATRHLVEDHLLFTASYGELTSQCVTKKL